MKLTFALTRWFFRRGGGRRRARRGAPTALRALAAPQSPDARTSEALAVASMLTTPALLPRAAHAPPPFAAPKKIVMADSSSVAGQVLAAMLDALDDFLPPVVLAGGGGGGGGGGGATLPPHGLSVVSVTESPVGLGNRRGTDLVGPFAVLALKGARLEAVVRFQVWAADPAGADALVTALQSRLAAASAAGAVSSPSTEDLGGNEDIFSARAINPGPWGDDITMSVVDQPPDESVVTFRRGAVEETYTVRSGVELAARTRSSSSLVVVETAGKPNAGARPLPVGNVAFSGTLRSAGFLRIDAAGATLAETGGIDGAWRSTADYRVLYEFRYSDADGAESLIARIPVTSGGDFPDETSESDLMVRWDEQGASALVVRPDGARPRRVEALGILAFLPAAWDGAAVRLDITSGGTPRPPQTFATVRDFLAAFATEDEVVLLGGNSYSAGRMSFTPPILLGGDADGLRVTYDEDGFDGEAVVYLRALG